MQHPPNSTFALWMWTIETVMHCVRKCRSRYSCRVTSLPPTFSTILHYQTTCSVGPIDTLTLLTITLIDNYIHFKHWIGGVTYFFGGWVQGNVVEWWASGTVPRNSDAGSCPLSLRATQSIHRPLVPPAPGSCSGRLANSLSSSPTHQGIQKGGLSSHEPASISSIVHQQIVCISQ